MTDAQFDKAQNAVDALTRRTMRGRKGTDAENARYFEVFDAWEAANALPQGTFTQRKQRDAALLDVATKYNLI